MTINVLSNRQIHENTNFVNNPKNNKFLTQIVTQKHQNDKIHFNKFGKWLQETFCDFCSSTALHGYNYIIRKESALWERIAWIVIVLCSIITSIIVLWISWNWNASTPTITVIESTHYASWNLPFPAITICNLNRISAKAATKLASKMIRPSNLSETELSAMFRYLLHFEGSGNSSVYNYSLLHDILTMNKMNVPKLTYELTPSCTDMLKKCMWKGTETRCDTLFQQVYTTKGYCCSFNYLGMKKSFYVTQTAHNIPKAPRRVTACGYQTGLTVLLKPHNNDYHSTFLNSYGFRVYMHSSYDYSDENAEVKLVGSKSQSFISVLPESTYSTDAVKHLPLSERGCLFHSEVQLNVMQNYSYVNCLLECRSSLFIRACNCLPYNLPNNGSIPVCEFSQLSCIIKNSDLFTSTLPGINHTISFTSEEFHLQNTPCQCLPDCEIIQYPAEITSGHFNRKYALNQKSFFKDIELEDETLLHIFFNDLVSTHYRKDVYQNWLSLLASFGGILGLLLGFSFVTGFEFIYFFTLRGIFNMMSNKSSD